jgi:hypothetical protein
MYPLGKIKMSKAKLESLESGDPTGEISEPKSVLLQGLLVLRQHNI